MSTKANTTETLDDITYLINVNACAERCKGLKPCMKNGAAFCERTLDKICVDN